MSGVFKLYYNDYMAGRYEKYKDLLRFRKAMGLGLSKDKIKYIWGRRFLKKLEEEGIKDDMDLNDITLRKLEIAKKEIPKLKVFDWVRFVGVSGSVAAGFAKEGDDIDIFVVVRNGTMWIYRAIIAFRNIFHNKIRAKRHRDVKNKLCVNLICEERGLEFPNDIFNMHELLFLIPIYNEEYKGYILSVNSWLESDFYVKKELLKSRIIPKKGVFFPLKFLNFLSFVGQLIFMFISGHNPETKRLVENYKKGRIEFFEYKFRIEKLEKYLSE
jgi:predicted nucleotidyltransferase